MHTQKQRRTPYPSDLTIRQFQMLAPLFAMRRRHTSRPPADLKDVTDGILYVLSTIAGLTALWKRAPVPIKDSAIWHLSSIISRDWRNEF